MATFVPENDIPDELKEVPMEDIPESTNNQIKSKLSEAIKSKAISLAKMIPGAAPLVEAYNLNEQLPESAKQLLPFYGAKEAFKQGYKSGEGITSALLDVPKESSVLDVPVKTLLGATSALGTAFNPVAPILSAADKGYNIAQDIAYQAGLKGITAPLSQQDLNEYAKYVSGEPSRLNVKEQIPTESVEREFASEVGKQFKREPITLGSALLMAGEGGLKLAKGVKAPIVSTVKTEIANIPEAPTQLSQKAIKLLNQNLNPSSTSQLGQNFPETATIFLDTVSRDTSPVIPKNLSEAKPYVSNLKDTIFARPLEMASKAEQSGITISSDPIYEALLREANDSFYKNHEPATAQRFIDEAEKYKGRSYPPLEAINDLKEFNTRSRMADKKVGAAEDVAESKFQYRINKLKELALESQLNEKLSPTPNAFKESYREYAAAAQISDLIDIAEAAERKAKTQPLFREALETGLPTNKVSFFKNLIGKVLPKITPSSEVSKALKIAKTSKMPRPTPIPPQKPSLLPKTKE